MTATADIAATVEGYYGTSIIHVGLGAAADLAASIDATASYTVSTNTWSFGGDASLTGYVKGYAAATAWPLKGEVYVQGNVSAAAALNATTGVCTANIAVVGTVGADLQMDNFLLGSWTTIAATSKNLGTWQASTSFNLGTFMQSEVNSIVGTQQTATVNVPT